MNYLDTNKALWNAKVQYHVASDFYKMPEFLAGASSLQPIELSLLGDVTNLSILHLQCHFGQDSISLARMGAQVTGLDFSEDAIRVASQLAQELNATASFVCADVYNTRQVINDTFDVVFTSYGTIGWLPNLDDWAQVIASSLKPNGRLVFVEFHPVVWMFDNDFKTIEYSYFNTEPIIETTTGTYADTTAPIENTSMSWNHSMAEVLQSLIQAGLQIQNIQEYDYSPYNCFSGIEQVAESCYRFPQWSNKVPLVYSVVAQKV